MSATLNGPAWFILSQSMYSNYLINAKKKTIQKSEKMASGRENSKSLACMRNGKEASVSGLQRG